MINYTELQELVRLVLHDTTRTQYSDYEIQQAINWSLNILINCLSEYYSPLLLKKVELELIDNTAELPEDFDGIEGVFYNNCELTPDYNNNNLDFNTFKIENNKIICSNNIDKINIIYKHKIQFDENNNIDLPEEFKTAIARATVLCINLTIDDAEAVLSKAVKQNKNKLYSNIKAPELFGGYCKL